MNKSFKEKTTLRGVAERRLFDTKKFQAVKEAILRGLPKVKIDILLNQAAKPQFADNFLWKLLSKLGLDLKIPFITGYWTTRAIKHNLIVTVGKAAVADQLGGTTTSPMTAVALGTGTTGAAAGNTTLETEIVADGGERGAATVSNQTTTTAGDTERWIKTFTITGTIAITEEGILDNNAAGGVLLARQVFSAVNVINGDSFQITHSVKVA